jgi:hypothetical protein
MEQRESNFLRLVERSVYGHPASPYLDLLKQRDVSSVTFGLWCMDKGLDAALTALRADGVVRDVRGAQGTKAYRTKRILA